MPPSPEAAVAIIRASLPRDSVLLLRRIEHPTDPWSGHFSFPGGRREETDPTLLATCLRETFEETGIALEPESMQTTLPANWAGRSTSTRILVQPFVFELDHRPPLELNHDEIATHHWLETRRFRQKRLHVEAEMLPDRRFPAFPLDDYYLWGFTYRLLTDLLESGLR